MATFTIYHGKEKPIRAIGKNQVKTLDFAFKYQGWHSFANDRATKRAVVALVKKGCLEVNQYDQFRFVFPK
jgi:hypothetical protein